MNILIVLVLGCAAVLADKPKICVINYNLNRDFLNVKLEKSPGQSVVVSSYSLLTPLAMLTFASQGQTKEELLKVIGITVDDVLRVSLPEINKKVASAEGITLKEASKIFIQDGFQIKQTYLDFVKLIFDSRIEEVDFNSWLTVDKINAWARKNTGNKINRVLDNLPPPNTLLILANAVYFKAKWATTFSNKDTKLRTFHVKKSHSVSIPFMYKKDFLPYTMSWELNAQLVELPYEGSTATFLAVIPNDIEGLNDLMKNLNSTSIQKAKENLMKQHVNLYLPKFKIDTTTDLKETLEELGLHTIFTNGADLRNLVENWPIQLSGGTQKVIVEIDEEGTEAAAVNIIDGELKPTMQRPLVTLEVDRPFYFEVTVGAVTIFSGVYIS